MKRLAIILFTVALGTRVLAADEFWQHLTPAERVAAGLDQLTPEQQVGLDQLATRFAKEGARQAVEVAKVQAREEARATAQGKKKATIGLAPREDDETEVVHSRISGDFRGWTGHTVFTLKNGQVWQQEQKESRFFPKMVDPEVEIRPSHFGGWKMTLLREGLWIRVKRIR